MRAGNRDTRTPTPRAVQPLGRAPPCQPCRSTMRFTMARPSPLPGASGSIAAREALEHAIALVGRDARSVVAHCDQHGVVALLDGHVDAAARRRVADRVVDQIGEQRLQRVGVAFDPYGVVRVRDAEVDGLRRGERRERCDDLARQRRQRRPCTNGRDVDAGLLARERQQLLDDAGCTREAAAQIGQRTLARLGVASRSATCACNASAASGVRNSCAASATKARCESIARSSRPSRPFSASTSGSTSRGQPLARRAARAGSASASARPRRHAPAARAHAARRSRRATR